MADQAPTRDRVYPPVIKLAQGAFGALRLDARVLHDERIPNIGGAMIAANHTGFLDFTFVGLAAYPKRRYIRFMCKSEVFDHPVAGPLMRGMHHIPVDRQSGGASFAAALRSLRAGELVGIFPEGTISRSFEPLPFKPGATALAAAAGVPLIPVAIWGSQRVLTKAGRRQKWRHKVPVVISVGEPMYFERREDHDAATERVRERIIEMLHELQDRYPDVPEGSDDGWWQPARLGGSAPTPDEALIIEAERRAAKEAKKAAKQKAPAAGQGDPSAESPAP